MHLHKLAVVHGLQQWYQLDKIYTAKGLILIALNSFEQEQGSYHHNHNHNTSANLADPNALPPHVLAVVDSAYRTMMRAMEDQTSRWRRTKNSLLKMWRGACSQTPITPHCFDANHDTGAGTIPNQSVKEMSGCCLFFDCSFTFVFVANLVLVVVICLLWSSLSSLFTPRLQFQQE